MSGNKILIMRRFFSVLLFLLVIPLHSQYFSNGKDWNFMRIYRPWGITLSGNLYPFGSETKPETAQLLRRDHLMWGFSAGLTYHLRFNNRWGLKFRVLAERTPVYSYRLYIPAAATLENKDFYDNTGNRYAPFSFHMHLGPEVRSFAIERYVLFLGTGADLSYSTGFYEYKQFNDYFFTFFANQPGFKYGFYVQAGWYYRFPWALWETAFVYRHQINGYYQGFYDIKYVNNYDADKGFIKQPANYIGLQFTWYFRKRFVGDGANCPGEVDSRKVKKRRKQQQKAREKARKRNEKMRKKLMRNKRKEQKKQKKNTHHRRKKFLGIF